MQGLRYVVNKGDTLWDLSEKFLGDPFKWPAIHAHNNKPDIVKLTGSRIANPDLIFVDQEIYIPNVENTKIAAASASPGRTSVAKEHIKGFKFRYSLEDIDSTQCASFSCSALHCRSEDGGFTYTTNN